MQLEPVSVDSPAVIDIGNSLESATQALAEGKWRKAERACEEILEKSNSPGAAFVLGQVYEASGQPKRALEWFQKAGEWDQLHAEAHFASAKILQSEGNLQEAAAAWIAGIEIDPTFLPAHLGLADTLLALGLSEAALIGAQQATLVDPDSADAWDRVARAAEATGNTAEAVAALERCIRLEPRSWENLRRLALVHRTAGNSEQCAGFFERALALQPRNASLRFEYAQILVKNGARQAAVEQLREALRLQSRFPEALSNLGLLLRAEQRFADAESAYKKACAQNPSFAPAWNNLANLYVEQVRLDEADRCYSKAIAIHPEYAEAHTGRAMLRLLKGRFEEGWAEYEWRWRQPGQQARTFVQPEWDGSSLDGRTILLHAEQGAGDTIQFIRYARILKQQNARVVAHCPASLRTLIQSMPEVDQVFCGKEPIPNFDVHAPMMSLPRLCRTDLSNIPGEVPYLSVPESTIVPDAVLKTDPPRVGLVWAGNPNHHNDRNRSIPPELLHGLLSLEGIRYFSLQLGGQPLHDFAGGMPVIDLGSYLSSYAVTAACIQNMDVLITVDTSVAHLAGALGRPVWMALPACNDWRWLLDRNDSPWYPSMRIFRQARSGDWHGVLEEIKIALQAEVRS